MQITHVDSLNATFEKSHLWLKELVDEAGLDTEAQAYTILRAVMHTLRDRLTVDESAHLASHLPMLIRGMFYEGWKPARTPIKYRSKEEFLGAIAGQLGNAQVDPEVACRAVFRFLSRKVNPGEINDVKLMLPAVIRELWNEPQGRRF